MLFSRIDWIALYGISYIFSVLRYISIFICFINTDKLVPVFCHGHFPLSLVSFIKVKDLPLKIKILEFLKELLSVDNKNENLCSTDNVPSSGLRTVYMLHHSLVTEIPLGRHHHLIDDKMKL